MDITITTASTPGLWHMRNLLGRAMGSIIEKPLGRFTIVPLGSAIDTMGAISKEPCSSLGEALAKIETQTQCVCRLAPEPDGECA